MMSYDKNLSYEVKSYCQKIGNDPLLIQGPGGNASWKEKKVLWIKGSGTWLMNAHKEEIFIPVSLTKLHISLAENIFDIKPDVISKTNLHPSIETLLHAIMPHKIVFHLHAIDILANLVHDDFQKRIENKIGYSNRYLFIDYFKPGPELAKEIYKKMINFENVDIIFLKNHGVVIGGQNIFEIDQTLQFLTQELRLEQLVLHTVIYPFHRTSDFLIRGYKPCNDVYTTHLIKDPRLINRLKNEWAVYPDHLVFLGAKPIILPIDFNTPQLDNILETLCPPYIFVINDGVYEYKTVTEAQKYQLRCYFDVISRQKDSDVLSTINEDQVDQLLALDT